MAAGLASPAWTKVKQGSHNAKRALIFMDRDLMNQIYEFMNLDFAVADFQAFRQSLITVFELPAFEFFPIGGESLYDMKGMGDSF